MSLNNLQYSVLKHIDTLTAKSRYISIGDLETSLTEEGMHIERQELFTILSSLKEEKKLDFTGPEEEFVYTINTQTTEEVAP